MVPLCGLIEGSPAGSHRWRPFDQLSTVGLADSRVAKIARHLRVSTHAAYRNERRHEGQAARSRVQAAMMRQSRRQELTCLIASRNRRARKRPRGLCRQLVAAGVLPGEKAELGSSGASGVQGCAVLDGSGAVGRDGPRADQ